MLESTWQCAVLAWFVDVGWLDHVPDHYETRVRYYGAYATRRRVWWRRRGIVHTSAAATETVAQDSAADWSARCARRRRWAELLRLVSKVEIERCPRCGSVMAVIAFVTEPALVRLLLAHLERRQVDARVGPWAGAAAAPG